MDARITRVTTPDDLEVVRRLFHEYAAAINVPLCTQGFEAEVRGLPGKYAEPTGCILLARVEEEPAGCVALRPAGEGIAEMKRLYVRPEWRGTGLGRALVVRLTEEARARGHVSLRLDTVPQKMPGAVALYRALGFVTIPPCWHSDLENVEFMELRLGP